jgi:hypothetical protein
MSFASPRCWANMGSYVTATIGFGYWLIYDDIFFAAGGKEVDYSADDWDEAEHANEDIDISDYLEKIASRFPLIGYQWCGDAMNWDEQDQPIFLNVKSTSVETDGSITPFVVGWLSDIKREEFLQLQEAYNKICNDGRRPLVKAPEWHLTWNRG